jgi:hypothetical protein
MVLESHGLRREDRSEASMQHEHTLVERLRAEFLEMPGLRLTMDQVHRLCGVERVMCSEVLEALVQEHFLCVKPDGSYARVSDGRPPRARQAKAAVPKRSVAS